MYFFLFLSRRQRERGSLIICFDKTLKGKKIHRLFYRQTRALFGSDLWRLVQKTTLFTFWRLRFKWPRQLSLPASAFSVQGRLTMEIVSPPTTGRPFTCGARASPRRPRRAGRPAGRLLQGHPPRGAFSAAVRYEGGEASRPQRSPGSSARYPPARPLARVPRPGRGPRRTACSPAAPGRPARPCTPRSLWWPGACRRGDRCGRAEEPRRCREGERWADGQVPGCSASVSADRGDGAARTNKPRGPAPAVTPPARRPHAPMPARGATESRPLDAVGRTVMGGDGRSEAAQRKTTSSVRAAPRSWFLRRERVRSAGTMAGRCGASPSRQWKANVPLPPASAVESLPSFHPLGFIYLERKSNQPLCWPWHHQEEPNSLYIL